MVIYMINENIVKSLTEKMSESRVWAVRGIRRN